MEKKLVAIVLDKREPDRNNAQEFLEEEGFETHGVIFPNDLEDAILKVKPDIIIIRVAYAAETGFGDELETYANLLNRGLLKNIKVIFTTLRTDDFCLKSICQTGRPLIEMPYISERFIEIVKKELR